ncbi:MAG: DsbA family protein [Candidatus Nealsonbacteria bacterium]|nr:DsbA family protein [Candidatus Nealsonbacteria bacterium]
MAKFTFTLDTKYFIPLAVVAAGAMIAIAILYTGGVKIAAVKPEVGIAELKTGGEPYLGNPDAKVKIVYYGDFQCPFCKRFESVALPEIKSRYLDSGKAVFYFKNFQFLGQDSVTAGIAGECAIKQSKGNLDSYWKLHNAMFEKQDAENAGFGSADDIKNLVRELNLGINLAEFDKCLDSRETEEEVLADTTEGRNDGVTGTPANFINGKLIPGAQAASVFVAEIEKSFSQ